MKAYLEYGAQDAAKVLETIKSNPSLLKQADKTLIEIVQEIGNGLKTNILNASKNGTVWDFIKATDVMYPNTKIPRSFELTIGDKKIWVAPNATKHMVEYLLRKPARHGIPIDSQILLKSFETSVNQAQKIGFVYNEAINIGPWQLVFSPPRNEGLFPVIKHAVYKP
ncbi:hypothetical protein GF322_02105 [Candidatus Dependentiae bacterium]|nr:hypothetical protein [Candidatus Dependentiae bacterium]